MKYNLRLCVKPSRLCVKSRETKNKLMRGLLLLLFLPFAAQSQLTLEKVQALARDNYPLIKQKDLIRQTTGLNLSNLNKGFLPQLSLNGQLTYQSEVTKVDVPIPGIKIVAPEKDQYKFTADVNQLIYDGGTTKQQKTLQQLNAAVEDQQVELELYNIKERINQVYLGILYLDEQMKQVDLVKQDLQIGFKKVEAQVQNGVAFRSNLNILKAELIRTDQRLIELKSSRKGLIETLSLFINQPLTEQTTFQRPDAPSSGNFEITRPEIKLFSEQHKVLDQQNNLITARNLPRTSLFVQGGYGRPGLNLLNNEFDFYYIGGLRFNWLLSGLYSKKNDRQIVKLNQSIVDIKKDAFLLNTNTEIKKQQNEIEKLDQLIETDNQIVGLRNSVTTSAKAQLENGVITTNDYLREVNAEDQSRQNLIFHELQLLQARIMYRLIIGQ
jgi:outer membrane protein TolC